MKILIVTSKNHWYANALLAGLIRQGVFNGDQVVVWEEDAIVPGKSQVAGVWKYIRVSGVGYVFWQGIKQMLFMLGRAYALIFRDKKSSCYPYFYLKPLGRETIRGIGQPDIITRVKNIHPDLLFSLFSKEIIPSTLLRIPTYGAVNFHPAPLPQYRGVTPTFWAMAEGKKTHGVTLHVLDAGIDTGPIIIRKLFPIQSYKSEHHLYLRCVEEGIASVRSYLYTVKRRKRIIFNHPTKEKGSYRSLPTKTAVKMFLERGMRFI